MYFCPSYTLSLFISLVVCSIDRLSVPLSFSPSNCPSSCPSILSALVCPCVCFLVRPFLPVHPKARTCMTRPSFLYSLHLTARAGKRIPLLIFDNFFLRIYHSGCYFKKNNLRMSWLSLSHFAIRPSARTFFCLSLYLAYLDLFFCIPVFPSLFVCKIHLSVCPIVYLHPHVLLYVLLSFFKLFVNPHFRPSDWSSLCHCVISSLFSQSPFLSINSGW